MRFNLDVDNPKEQTPGSSLYRLQSDSIHELSEKDLEAVTGGFLPGLNEIVAGFRLIYTVGKLVDRLLEKKSYSLAPSPYPEPYWYSGTHENT